MMSCERFPLRCAMNPTPQASFSRAGCQRPWGSGQPNGDFCDVGVDVIVEIEISRARSPRKARNQENRWCRSPGFAKKAREIKGLSQRAEETDGNLLSEGGPVKTGGVGDFQPWHGWWDRLRGCRRRWGWNCGGNCEGMAIGIRVFWRVGKRSIEEFSGTFFQIIRPILGCDCFPKPWHR